ncbi:MAG: SHOCT-like domain-containing protein, partial [Chloroflexota bacterium]
MNSEERVAAEKPEQPEQHEHEEHQHEEHEHSEVSDRATEGGAGDDERMRVLRMVADGRISADEAAELLAALEPPPSEPAQTFEYKAAGPGGPKRLPFGPGFLYSPNPPFGPNQPFGPPLPPGAKWTIQWGDDPAGQGKGAVAAVNKVATVL